MRGSLDEGLVRRVIRQHLREIEWCYENELATKPDLKGRAVVRFTITVTGSVVAAIVKSSTPNDEQLEVCMLQKIGRWQFPQPESGIVIVQYPFSLDRAK